MWINPYETKRWAEERRKDTHRQLAQERLLPDREIAKHRWVETVGTVASALMALIVSRR